LYPHASVYAIYSKLSWWYLMPLYTIQIQDGDDDGRYMDMTKKHFLIISNYNLYQIFLKQVKITYSENEHLKQTF